MDRYHGSHAAQPLPPTPFTGITYADCLNMKDVCRNGPGDRSCGHNQLRTTCNQILSLHLAYVRLRHTSNIHYVVMTHSNCFQICIRVQPDTEVQNMDDATRMNNYVFTFVFVHYRCLWSSVYGWAGKHLPNIPKTIALRVRRDVKLYVFVCKIQHTLTDTRRSRSGVNFVLRLFCK